MDHGDYRGQVDTFLSSGADRHTLGLVYGRRRMLLLFAQAFTAELRSVAARRADVELVDLDRLYHGA